MGSKILLADDSITIQKVVNLTFADEGIEVVAVSNGDMAERRLADVNPDLVLADIFMPGKNGYELCESIKKSQQFSKVPVVLLIGAFEPFNEAEARRVHADAHLTKPFESRTLVETVRKLISVSGQARTGPITQPQTPDPEVKKEEPRPSYATRKVEALNPADFLPPPQAPIMAQPSEMSMAALNDAAPLDIEYSSADVSVSVSPDGSSLPDNSAFNSSQGWSRRTDDLSFSTDPAPFQSFNLSDSNFEVGELSAPISVAVEEQPTDFSINSQVADTPLIFRDAEDVQIDYGKADGQADYEAIGFEVEARDPFDVDASGLRPDEEAQSQAVQSHDLETTRLDMHTSPVTNDSIVDTNPLEMPAASGKVDFGFGEQEGDSGDPAALLAVDEPLGDVLMDEAVRESFSSGQSEQPLDQSLTGEAFGMEFIPQETTVAPDRQSTATSDVTVARSEVESAHDQAFSVGTSVEPSNEVAEAVSFEVATPLKETAQEEPAGEPVIEVTSVESTAQAEPVADAAGNADAVFETDFAAYQTWQGEETNFAPIDIEATPVEESAVANVKAEGGQNERGFEFATSTGETARAGEEPARSVAPVFVEPVAETPPAQEHSAVEAVAPETSGQTAEISPALIDEIVRRVVARMSDSVVREIAWEVVPDCVERVIKDMTRQELSKR